MGVEDEPLERCIGIAHRRRDPFDDRIEEGLDPFAGLRADTEDLRGGDAEHLLDLGGVAVGIGGRQIDLVECGDDLEVVLEGEVAVGEGLGLDPLRCVDEQDRPLAGGERTAHLVSEVDVTRCVDEVDRVTAMLETDALELDRDAPFTLDVHRIEVLRPHLPGIDGAAQLEQTIGEGGLAMIDVSDDAEVAETFERGHGGGRSLGRGAQRAYRSPGPRPEP